MTFHVVMDLVLPRFPGLSRHSSTLAPDRCAASRCQRDPTIKPYAQVTGEPSCEPCCERCTWNANRDRRRLRPARRKLIIVRDSQTKIHTNETRISIIFLAHHARKRRAS
eukprot:253753-Prymnesium_polylepis.1